MAGIKNTFTSFIILGVIIALFIGLITILAKILVIGLFIGGVLFVFFWLKNKILGNPRQKQAQKYKEEFFKNFYYYSNKPGSKQNNSYEQHTYYEEHHSSNNKNNQKHKKQGRIIDVEPDK